MGYFSEEANHKVYASFTQNNKCNKCILVISSRRSPCSCTAWNQTFDNNQYIFNFKQLVKKNNWESIWLFLYLSSTVKHCWFTGNQRAMYKLILVQQYDFHRTISVSDYIFFNTLFIGISWSIPQVKTSYTSSYSFILKGQVANKIISGFS